MKANCSIDHTLFHNSTTAPFCPSGRFNISGSALKYLIIFLNCNTKFNALDARVDRLPRKDESYGGMYVARGA